MVDARKIFGCWGVLIKVLMVNRAGIVY